MFTEDVRQSQYFKIVVTSDGHVSQVVAGSHSDADSGTRWFLLRVGCDRPGVQEIGLHACDLTANQQRRIKEFIAANQEAAQLLGDWLDWYPNEEYEARHQLYGHERLTQKLW